MTTARLIALIFTAGALCAISAAAQDIAPPNAAPNLVFIDTRAFVGAEGINRYTKALDAAIGETGPIQQELKAIGLKMEALEKVVTGAGGGESAASQFQARIVEYRRLEVEFKRKQEEKDAILARRRREVLPPVLEDIKRAMAEFAAQKGYSLILDAAELEPAVLVCDLAKLDVTKQFIAFYNARPAVPAKP